MMCFLCLISKHVLKVYMFGSLEACWSHLSTESFMHKYSIVKEDYPPKKN